MDGAYHPSNGFFEKAGANASCTGLHALHSSRLIVYAPNFLKIGVPNLHTLVVRVADFVTHNRFLATYLADSGHTNSPL